MMQVDTFSSIITTNFHVSSLCFYVISGSALNLIRIPAMELHEFADGPAQTGILSLKESHDLFLYFTASVKPKVSYPIKSRPGLVPQVSTY